MLELEGCGMKQHRTDRSGLISAGSAISQRAMVKSHVQPTVTNQTTPMYVPVDVPLGDKGTSHGTVIFVMVHNSRAKAKVKGVSSLICTCGRLFHRQGDLTRHSHFCDSM